MEVCHRPRGLPRTHGFLAARIGVHPATTPGWLAGRPPADFHVPRLADGLGVAVETIQQVLAR